MSYAKLIREVFDIKQNKFLLVITIKETLLVPRVFLVTKAGGEIRQDKRQGRVG